MTIIEQLISKAELTTQESMSTWWGPEISSDLNGKLPSLLEWDESGCWASSLDSVIYYNFEAGRTQKISKNYDSSHWDLYQKLYILVHEKVRISVPITRELVLVNNETWEFTDVMVPGRTHGEHFDDTSGFLSADWTNLAVDTFTEVLRGLIQISKENNSGTPSLAFDLKKDRDGWYMDAGWSEWSLTPSKTVENLIENIERSGLSKILGVDETIINRAKTEWRALL